MGFDGRQGLFKDWWVDLKEGIDIVVEGLAQ
jgi:hypothetical protein